MDSATGYQLEQLTSTSGQFVIGPLRPGSYQIAALPVGDGLGMSERLTVRAPSAGVVLGLGGTSKLTVCAVDKATGKRLYANLQLLLAGQDAARRMTISDPELGVELMSSAAGPVVLSASAQGKRFGALELESLDAAVRAGTIEIPVELQGQVSVTLERWPLTAQLTISLNAHLEISQDGRCCWRDEVYVDNSLLMNVPAGEIQVRAFKLGPGATPGNPKSTFDQTKTVHTQAGVVTKVVFSGEQ